MSRRRPLRLLGGALVSAVVPLTRPGLQAGRAAPSRPGKCGQPGQNCDNGTSRTLVCGCDFYEGCFKECCDPTTQICCQSDEGPQSPGHAPCKNACCDKDFQKCGTGKSGDPLCVCAQPCGKTCCNKDQFCYEKDANLCCNDGERGCRQGYAGGPVVRAFCCPTGTRCCAGDKESRGTDCCGKDQICDNKTDFCRCSKTAKPCGQYACCEKGETCCPGKKVCCKSRKECCGERCCLPPSVCGRRVGINICCSQARLRPGGFCCPFGTVPAPNGCCPPADRDCCTGDLPPLPRKGYVCVNGALVKG